MYVINIIYQLYIIVYNIIYFTNVINKYIRTNTHTSIYDKFVKLIHRLTFLPCFHSHCKKVPLSSIAKIHSIRVLGLIIVSAIISLSSTLP